MRLERWEAAAVPADVDGVPSPDEWVPVEVPGRPARFAGADAVAYRTSFDDPRDGRPRAVLELAGVYARADVWLNGERLGDHDVYFTPARFDVEPEDDNELVVVCRAPDDRFGGVYDTDLVPPERAVPGIWWDARVEGRPETYVANLTAIPRIEDGDATIDAALTVDAGAAVDNRITLSLRPEGFRGGGMMERARVEADAGESATVEASIDVRDPRFWWPRGHGEQHRYAVRAKLGDYEETVTTGLRTVERTDDGLLVNGERVRARGFNLLPEADPAVDVTRAAGANANLVRVYGHVPSRAFLDACDEAGLLVWQDLPLVGPDEYDADRARALAARVAGVTRRHPSVIAYGVHADPVDVAAGLADKGLHRWRLRWRAWRASYDGASDEDVADVLPDDVPSFPVVGQPGVDPDASALYPGWDYGTAADVDGLVDWNPDLGDAVGAFGAGALADPDGADAAGFDEEKHAVHVDDGVVAASQAHQARVLKRVAERLRREGSDVLAAFALRDADAGAGMGVLARDGEEKRGYAALADAFEPVQAVLHGWPAPGDEMGVTVVNDTPEAVAGSVEWEAGDALGTADVEVGAFERVALDDAVPIGANADRTVLRLDVGDETVTNTYRLE